MSQALLSDKRFHQLLLQLDEELARATRAGRCRLCGGVLHSARYRRKPRGVPPGLAPEYNRCASFCCAVDGCRTRHRAPSMRFLARRVYVASAVVLISAMRCGATPTRMRTLEALIGVSRRTVARWRSWWRNVFSASAFYRAAVRLILPPIDAGELPAALLERFAGTAEERLLALLRFLVPITTGIASVPAG